jgi:autotransporter-associated beta strand protein
MNKLIVAAIRCCLMFLLPTAGYAISAQWDLDPISGDWNTAANWTPNGVPNGPADIATFGLSNTTNVSISANTEVNGIAFTSAATNPYTITASPGLTLIISGVGITNNSGTTQSFVAAVNGAGNQGKILFTNAATAGSSTTFTNQGAVASLVNGGFTAFADHSSAGNGIFINNGSVTNNSGGGFTTFGGTSSAANGTFINNAGTHGGFFGSGGGDTFFGDTSSAGNATIINNGVAVSGAQAGNTRFSGMATAGSATIINNGATVGGFFGSQGGFTVFFQNSTAGSATIIANSGIGGGAGGQILFEGDSNGGTSQIEVFGNGSLDISRHNTPGVSIGSVEGDGNVFLGGNNLTVGSNNLSTNFSGVIQNGGAVGGIRGSLTKGGSGTLILSGANTYTGNTKVQGGVLQVDGSITSNTYVNASGTLAGTGTVYRNVRDTAGGTVSPGHALGTLSISGNYTQTSHGTLLINIAGTSTGQFSVLDVNGFASLIGAYEILDPALLNGFAPTIGDSFTFLNYTSLNGTFFISDANIDNLNAHWEITYRPSSAILTVAPGNVPIIPIPDQGSTFLLLTLGLLGLVTYRRQLLRGQS